MNAESIRKALDQAFQLGQTYWQQADSESISQHRKADATRAMLQELKNTTADDIDSMTADAYSGADAGMVDALREQLADAKAQIEHLRDALNVVQRWAKSDNEMRKETRFFVVDLDPDHVEALCRKALAGE